MKYQIYGKKIDGTTEKFGVPSSLSSATHKIKMLTWMENRRSNKYQDYLYFYCLPVKEEEI